MKMKLIGEIESGFAFHYHGNEDRTFIKFDKVTALNPDGHIRRVSPNTLVVPHEGQFKKSEENKSNEG